MMAQRTCTVNHVRSNEKSQKGFTLIETAISLIIMMVVCLGAASLFAYATRANSFANEREIAMGMAQKRMEYFRTVPFSVTNRNLDIASGGLGATAGINETVSNAGRTFIVTTIIEDVSTVPAGKPDAGAPTVKRITVRVAPGQPGSLGTVALTTERSTQVPGVY